MPPPPRHLVADRGDAGHRLDLVLRRHLTDVRAASRTRVQRWIETGLVTVNGAAVRRVSSRVAFGDDVRIDLPDGADRPPARAAAEDIGLSILYEDDHLLAIDKPAGMVVHPTYKHAEGTTLNALLWHARGWPAGDRPSLVGRLDKLTSGVVLVAKRASVHRALQRAMASADSEKSYLAVVHGRVNAARGDIDLRLGPDASDRRRMVASLTRGQPSLTRFERVARGAEVTLLRCRLVTGRTHQIRVHLAARGWPLVGDPVYGDAARDARRGGALVETLHAFPRQALHAWRVAFVHPVTHARVTIEAPIPRDLADLLVATGLRATRSPVIA